MAEEGEVSALVCDNGSGMVKVRCRLLLCVRPVWAHPGMQVFPLITSSSFLHRLDLLAMMHLVLFSQALLAGPAIRV